MDEPPREGFLRRWARLKEQANGDRAPAATPPARAEDEPPELPSLDELTFESDYGGFFHPKVDEALRRAALRKLFSEPHFNVMDGLDVYIDDYSKTEPLPSAMLKELQQAQNILRWAAESQEPPAGQAAAATAVQDRSPDAAPEAETDATAGTDAAPISPSYGEDTRNS